MNVLVRAVRRLAVLRGRPLLPGGSRAPSRSPSGAQTPGPPSAPAAAPEGAVLGGAHSGRAGWRADPLLRWGARAWAVVGVVVAAYLLLEILSLGRILLVPLLVALVTVYVLNPVVSGLHRIGMPRWLAAAATGLAALGLVVLGLVLVLPTLTEQVQAAITSLPSDLEELEARAESLARRAGIGADVDLDGEAVRQWLGRSDNRSLIFGSLSTVGSAAVTAAQALLLVLAGLILALFVLSDLPRLGRAGLAVVPPAHREEVREVASDVGRTVGGFLRGQLVVATFVGVASAAALWLVGLPLWLLVGVVAGVTNLVPFIGPFVGGALAVGIALAEGDVAMAVWSAVAIFVVQQVESHLVSPYVMGRVVRLHPAAVLLIALLAASLAGLIGLLVAVPLAASARVVVRHLWRRSVSYAGDPPT